MEHVKHHLKHMAIAAVAIVVVLAIVGVDLGQALRYGIILACPVGMIGMMFMMGKNQDGAAAHQHGAKATEAPQDADGRGDQRFVHRH
jgi:H+/gluconate symporter-like permease